VSRHETEVDAKRNTIERATETNVRKEKPMNRSWLTAAAAVLFVVSVGCAPAAHGADITGKYRCEGTNAEGKTYTGTVEITKVGDTYKVAWTLGSGESYEGVGILEGDVLGVSFGGGVVVYKVEKGKMSGKWTVPDAKGKVFTETLTK
jgi:hypothetical protein